VVKVKVEVWDLFKMYCTEGENRNDPDLLYSMHIG
jgi:hypothetical protein